MAAPAETVLHAFTDGSDGGDPLAGLIADSKGNLYGAASTGGASGYGAVLELSPPSAAGGAWTETVLHSFHGSPNDGYNPEHGLIAGSNGNLYGVTIDGGGTDSSVVFELSPSASVGASWTDTVIHTFSGIDGNLPNGLIAGSNGNLYGTAEFGGNPACNVGCGVVFELSPPAVAGETWAETVLYAFTGGNDGAYPASGLIADSKGNLYGTASYGGSSGGIYGLGYGVVFELSPPAAAGGTWTETVLHSFNGIDGANPSSSLITDSEGHLYGMTTNGGASGNGVVFELSPSAAAGAAWTDTLLHTFTGGEDGGGPEGGLIADLKGNLFGTAAGGGASGKGVVFELSPPAAAGGTWTETVLHVFVGPPSDGAYPYAGLIADSNGNLYGTTLSGGSFGAEYGGFGTVFELTGTGFVTDIPFAAFRSDLEIKFGRRPNTDAFELLSEFTLGKTSSGIDPLTEPLTLTIGSFTKTLPPGTFLEARRREPYYFFGIIDGVNLEVVVAKAATKRFEFAATAWNADLSGTTNPVPVTLTIGNNTGTDSITLPKRGW